MLQNCLKQKFNKSVPLGIIVFLFFLSIYVLTMAGHFYVIHDQALYFVGQNMVMHGNFTYMPDGQPYIDIHNLSEEEDRPGTETALGMIGRDGYAYAKYGFGQSLAVVPLFLIGKAIFGSEPKGIRFVALTFTPIITALSCVLIFLFIKRLKFSSKVGFSVCLIYGLTTLAWPYTRYFFEQPLVGFLLLFSCYALYLYKQSGQIRWLLFSGIALGFSVATRLASIMVTPLLLFYALSFMSRKKIDLKNLIQRLAIFLIPLLISIILIMSYNYIRFGSIWQTGYGSKIQLFTTPMYEGLFGQLLSPGKGLFIYAPSLILFFIGTKDFIKRNRAEAVLFMSMPLIYLLFYSRHVGWDGGFSWGPRHMVTVSAFLIMPVSSVIEKIYLDKRKLLVLIVIFLVGLSFIIQFLAVGLDYVNVMTRMGIEDSQDHVFEPKHSSIIGLFRFWPSHLKQTVRAIKQNLPYQGEKKDFFRDNCLDFWFIITYAVGGKIRLFTKILVALLFLSMIMTGYLISKRIYVKG